MHCTVGVHYTYSCTLHVHTSRDFISSSSNASGRKATVHVILVMVSVVKTTNRTMCQTSSDHLSLSDLQKHGWPGEKLAIHGTYVNHHFSQHTTQRIRTLLTRAGRRPPPQVHDLSGPNDDLRHPKIGREVGGVAPLIGVTVDDPARTFHRILEGVRVRLYVAQKVVSVGCIRFAEVVAEQALQDSEHGHVGCSHVHPTQTGLGKFSKVALISLLIIKCAQSWTQGVGHRKGSLALRVGLYEGNEMDGRWLNGASAAGERQ